MRLTFIRHAHAAHAGDDIENVLSPKGIAQALTYRKLSGYLEYDCIIHSSAIRTKETADILLYNSPKSVPYVEIPSLYLPKEENDISEVSKSVMLYSHSPPAHILKNDLTGAWGRYADTAFGDIISAIKAGEYTSEAHILIIGHSTIINLVALRFVPGAAGIDQQYIRHMNGFCIEIDFSELLTKL